MKGIMRIYCTQLLMSDSILMLSKMFLYDKYGKCQMRKTMAGVDLLVAIKDGVNLDDGSKKISKTQIPLKDMKESYIVYVAKFAVVSNINKIPAFSQWVHHVLKKRDTIIVSVKARVKKCIHKCSIEVPTSVQHMKLFDMKNNKQLQMNALAKKMVNIGVAFEVLEHSQPTPVAQK